MAKIKIKKKQGKAKYVQYLAFTMPQTWAVMSHIGFQEQAHGSYANVNLLLHIISYYTCALRRQITDL